MGTGHQVLGPILQIKIPDKNGFMVWVPWNNMYYYYGTRFLVQSKILKSNSNSGVDYEYQTLGSY
jgi:hypothetical protein